MVSCVFFASSSFFLMYFTQLFFPALQPCLCFSFPHSPWVTCLWYFLAFYDRKGWEVLAEKLSLENCSRPVPWPSMIRRDVREDKVFSLLREFSLCLFMDCIISEWWACEVQHLM